MDENDRPSDWPPHVPDNAGTVIPPSAPEVAGASDETKRVAKHTAVRTIVVLAIVGALAAVIIPIVVYQQNQADEEQRYRDRVSEITDDLVDRE